MSKKSDAYYFDNFIECSACAVEAARMLETNLKNFQVAALEENLNHLHRIEHSADKKKHEMMGVLVKAFITPIEREDIMLLSQSIDEVTDKIEDVLIRVFINNVQSIRPEAVSFADIIIRCCENLKEIMDEFADYKKSKNLHSLIIGMNELEEEGDRLFMTSMRRLHTEVTDPLEIIAWREVFIYLEKCCDACEHVADVVESVMMKNS
ncbi:DUF47 domain-containing protein [Lacrimispora sp. 210928-DFI.3.58]|uniref:DUF47 domain-containing protein n=1 Tax=Lacrimispora sp. 210928-DFI.3.58 TaxID=2883214 RepID=UPI0015B55372|nr:DUF47 family protein [Lacrimispora sp. 210928-DFI.3.58]MCB7321323.1 DUF47 family protein [Lacrimispora sp. 210928-DFI.3.58]